VGFLRVHAEEDVNQKQNTVVSRIKPRSDRFQRSPSTPRLQRQEGVNSFGWNTPLDAGVNTLLSRLTGLDNEFWLVDELVHGVGAAATATAFVLLADHR